MAEVLLSFEDATERHVRGDVVSVRAAHKVLHQMRAKLTAPVGSIPDQPNLFGFTQEVVDMTHDTRFDWRGYVANRSRDLLQVVVGPGITGFELRFLKPIDRNCRQNRCDFVAHRADGQCVRFHPGNNGDAKPVIVPLHTCAIASPPPQGLPAASQGDVFAGPQPQVYEHASQHDRVTNREAVRFIDGRVEQWEQPGGGGVFRENLTSQEAFPWFYYLSGLDQGRAYLEVGVSSFWLAWVAPPWNRAGFYVSLHDGTDFVIFPGHRPLVQPAAVDSIRWSV
jgi:hypothetical protein